MHPLHPASCSFCLRVCAFTFVLLASAPEAASQLACAPCDLSFYKVTVGQSMTQTVTLTNVGPTTIVISASKIDGSGFLLTRLRLPLTLRAGGSSHVSVIFKPTAPGLERGAVKFRSNASNSILPIELRAYAVAPWALAANPPFLQFGKVPTGSSVTLPFALSNNGRTRVTITQQGTVGSEFEISGLTVPTYLNPGHSITLNATFSPLLMGRAGGSFLVTNPHSPVLQMKMEGSGSAAGQLLIAPPTVSFGKVATGQSESLPVTLHASGASVTLYSASSSHPDYTFSGLSFPVTLLSGRSLPFTVSFSPRSLGPVAASLSFVSNSADTPLVTSLTGTGAVGHIVTLSWNASTSPVIGYNIYRSFDLNGPYFQINSSLDVDTTYADATVVSGETYFYATKAVGSDGRQSVPSNTVQVVIR